MSLMNSLTLWLLENRRDLYIRLKKLGGLAISEDDRFFDIHLELLRDQKGTQTLFERYNLYQWRPTVEG